MTIEIRVPTLGESVTEATVATWFKSPGDLVARDEMLCELETDKVTVEVTSPASGVFGEVIVPEGGSVGLDALLATISEDGEAKSPTTNSSGVKSGTTRTSIKADVVVPALGESVTEATVASWFKEVGDRVKQDEVLCELETDKVTVEVPAPDSGVIREILAPEGTTVEASARLAIIGESLGEVSSETVSYEITDKARGLKDFEDAPSAKKAMAEANLSRDELLGTGRDGRIMKHDVNKIDADIGTQIPPIPRAPASSNDASREERIKMTKLRQTIARRLKDSQNTAAMLTTYNEVDMSEVIAIRSQYKELFLQKHGVKLGFMSFFTKACCIALKEVPEVNAEIDGTDIIYKNFVHMGIATGTPTGLVVPVIREADDLSFAAIEKLIAEKGLRAREGKLSISEMQGGTFTISNGGVYGSLMSSPILNPPQSGILGIHKIQNRPVALDNEVVIRPMMYLALSYDHRIVDGQGAVTFLVRVKEAMEDPKRLLIDL